MQHRGLFLRRFKSSLRAGKSRCARDPCESSIYATMRGCSQEHEIESNAKTLGASICERDLQPSSTKDTRVLHFAKNTDTGSRARWHACQPTCNDTLDLQISINIPTVSAQRWGNGPSTLNSKATKTSEERAIEDALLSRLRRVTFRGCRSSILHCDFGLDAFGGVQDGRENLPGFWTPNLLLYCSFCYPRSSKRPCHGYCGDAGSQA